MHGRVDLGERSYLYYVIVVLSLNGTPGGLLSIPAMDSFFPGTLSYYFPPFIMCRTSLIYIKYLGNLTGMLATTAPKKNFTCISISENISCMSLKLLYWSGKWENGDMILHLKFETEKSFMGDGM